jgi:dipeptidyl aminopeptidase/acylaminoacyl peptidase
MSRPVFEQFYAYRGFQPVLAFTADSSALLFSTNISGQYNLWRLPVEGGWPRQMTTFEGQAVRGIAPSPDGSTIVFSADRDGDEFHQLYAIEPGGGWPVALTDADQVQHELAPGAWDPEGRRLAYAANSRAPTDMDVWVHDAVTGETSHVFGEDQYAIPVSFSPDGERLLCLEAFGDNERPYLVDLAGGTSRALTSGDERARFSPGPWAADGSGFWVVSDLGREFAGLAFFDLSGDRDGDGGGRLEWVETPDRNVEEVAGDRAGTVLVWMVNEDGRARMYGRDLRRGEPLPAADLPDGCGTAFGASLTVSGDGRYAALLWSQPERTHELYIVELASGRSRRLTDSMLGGLAPEQLVAPALVSYRSTDDLRVPAWLYRPDRADRLPVVLSVHGGPEAQERPEYRPLYQFLCSRGIAVLATNIRGSTGYGKSYQRRIHRDWGGGDLEDLRHAALWLRAQEWVDPDRLGVLGGSYGGFATLSCVTRLPEYWAAAVDRFGPSNLVTFAKAVPPTWRRVMARVVGDPETEAEFLTERSPITYLEQVTAPLLVIQGANDPRVVRAESDQLVERLRELGREVEYVVFDDEGHGFTRRSNELRAYRLTADWFIRHLTS